MLLFVSKEVTTALNLFFFKPFKVCTRLSVSTIFTLKIAPIVDLTTFGLYASAVFLVTNICFKFTLSAVLKIVPKLPGS